MLSANSKQPKTVTLILAFLIFVGIVVFLNHLINRQVEEATATLDQAQVNPPKLIVVNKPAKKKITLEPVAAPVDNSSIETMTQPVAESKPKKNKVVYEMPINDESLPL
jgi:hypothetical protein